MSFYSARSMGSARMGFAPLLALMPVVAGALRSNPLDTRNPYAAPSNTALTVAIAVGGLALVGGAFYYAILRPRSKRGKR